MILEDIDFGTLLYELLKNDDITDIMIWDKDLWITNIKYGHYRYDLKNVSLDLINEFYIQIRRLPRQLATRMKRAYNDASPIIDGEAHYDDLGQLRFNIIHESLINSDYPAIAIRKTLYDLRIDSTNMIETGYADDNFITLMAALVDAGCNVMIGGETGSGKTELLRYIARWIRNNEAIITMEDTLEVYLKRLYPLKNVLSLKTTKNLGFDSLLRACLRQNPDWICVSETRGKEVLALNDAVSTGHRLLSTLHTDSAINIPYRMLNMGQLKEGDAERVFKQIHHNINVGIHICYQNDAKSHRYINEICEFYLDNNKPVTHMLYSYDHQKQSYLINKISSPTILSKLVQKQTDVSKLKGKFL